MKKSAIEKVRTAAYPESHRAAVGPRPATIIPAKPRIPRSAKLPRNGKPSGPAARSNESMLSICGSSLRFHASRSFLTNSPAAFAGSARTNASAFRAQREELSPGLRRTPSSASRNARPSRAPPVAGEVPSSGTGIDP